MTIVSNYKEILDTKNYNLSIINDLNALSSPITNYGIRLLTFRRIYSDGKILHFSNDLSWLYHSFNYQLWQSTSSINRIKKVAFTLLSINLISSSCSNDNDIKITF
jgi:hypothetical protein